MIPEKTKTKAIKMKQSGFSNTEISKKLNISMPTVGRVVGKRYVKLSPQMRADIKKLFKEGKSKHYIARQIGVSITSVQNVVGINVSQTSRYCGVEKPEMPYSWTQQERELHRLKKVEMNKNQQHFFSI